MAKDDRPEPGVDLEPGTLAMGLGPDEGSDFILECSREGVLDGAIATLALPLSLDEIVPGVGFASAFTLSDFALSDFSLSDFTSVLGSVLGVNIEKSSGVDCISLSLPRAWA